MEENTRLGYGIGLGLLAMGLFVVYVPVLLILFVDKEFRRSTAYIIITHIGVMDVLQLLIHMYAAVAVIADIHIQSVIQKVIGALLTGLWFSMICFTIFLTFNRLSSILLERWFPILTSLYLNYVLFGVCYLSFIIPFLLKLLPFCNYVFNPRTFSWSYLPTDDVLSAIMSETSTYLLLVFVIASTITYASIFCYIGFFSSSKLSKREFRITIQVIADRKMPAVERQLIECLHHVIKGTEPHQVGILCPQDDQRKALTEQFGPKTSTPFCKEVDSLKQLSNLDALIVNQALDEVRSLSIFTELVVVV
ncbi:unnamed protein product [Haemonchus placei]|uniref:7TM_GPCR_Srx domain-containing protein n=1 Tax=Haemonchus placei TaxID=6290 RepID=A0A0N4X5K2_HAEPC|nr:unnamed protein product [Haemonchus placei]